MRALLIADFQTTLSLANAEAPQPIYIRGCVVVLATLSTAGKRQRSKSFTEPQPARANAQLVRGFADAECPSLSEHTDIEKPVSKESNVNTTVLSFTLCWAAVPEVRRARAPSRIARQFLRWLSARATVGLSSAAHLPPQQGRRYAGRSCRPPDAVRRRPPTCLASR